MRISSEDLTQKSIEASFRARGTYVSRSVFFASKHVNSSPPHFISAHKCQPRHPLLLFIGGHLLDISQHQPSPPHDLVWDPRHRVAVSISWHCKRRGSNGGVCQHLRNATSNGSSRKPRSAEDPANIHVTQLGRRSQTSQSSHNGRIYSSKLMSTTSMTYFQLSDVMSGST